MPSPLSEKDFAHIAAALGVEAEREGAVVRYRLSHAPSGRRLAIEISPDVALPRDDGAMALVSAYGVGAFLQLQNVTGVVASRELGEVIFFAREEGRVAGLVVEREAGCSLYANVSEKLLSADFTQLPPEVMISAVALSMSEPLFE